MSVTLYIKYALAHVTVKDVTWVFNELCGGVVVKVTELVKQDRYNRKDFKIFFIECDQAKQTGSNFDKLIKSITHNMEKGDKKGARVTIDKYGHYWQVTLAKPFKPASKPAFKPRIMEEEEQETEFLRGNKRGAEEGEVVEPKRERISGIFESNVSNEMFLEALRDTIDHFTEIGLYPPQES